MPNTLFKNCDEAHNFDCIKEVERKNFGKAQQAGDFANSSAKEGACCDVLR